MFEKCSELPTSFKKQQNMIDSIRVEQSKTGAKA
jgi:hypothetical protein